VLGWERADVIARGQEGVPPAAAGLFREAIEQRARRRPLQHLTGHQAFWRHDFVVTPDVLVPRPETEVLVEASLEALRGMPTPVVVDVGTGSGCIAVSLAAERADARIHAVDVSAGALAVARGNATRLGVAGRVTFHLGDLLAPVAEMAGAADLVVSNPPYVTAEEVATLAPEVRDHDPRPALVPAEGVPSLYRRLFGQAAAVVKPGGWVIVEVGSGQSELVAALAREAGLDVSRTLADLAGIPRAVVARRPASP
jgi:release factor glutamine methyltransferase